jgi:hypothetical protein
MTICSICKLILIKFYGQIGEVQVNNKPQVFSVALPEVTRKLLKGWGRSIKNNYYDEMTINSQ